jgi:cyclic-di-AMP phosphodiesterase PgpH
MDKRKSFFKKSLDEIHLRSKYIDPSRRFGEWFEDTGLKDTNFARAFNALDSRFSLRNWGLIFIFCFVLSFLIFWDVDVFHQVSLGNIAPADIKAPISFQMTDELATEEKRKLAEEAVPPVFDYDANTYEQLINRVYKGFRHMRKEIKGIHWMESQSKREEDIKDFNQFKPEFEKELGIEVPDRLFEWLTENKFAAPYENILIRALVKWSSRRVMDGQAPLFKAADSPLLVRVVSTKAGGGDEFSLHRDEVYDMKRLSDFDLEDVAGIERMTGRDRKNSLDFARLLLAPNLTFNRQETVDRRQKTREAVLPVQISIKKGQTIVKAGTVVQPLEVSLINELNALKSSRRTDFVSFVVAFLFMILITVFFSYLRRVSQPY